jgi:hypothetical protein
MLRFTSTGSQFFRSTSSLLVLVERNGMTEPVRHALVLLSAQNERSRGWRYDNG